MFALKAEESANLKSLPAVSGWGGRRKVHAEPSAAADRVLFLLHPAFELVQGVIAIRVIIAGAAVASTGMLQHSSPAELVTLQLA